MKGTEIYRVDSHETRQMIFIAACPDAQADWTLQKKLLIRNLHPRNDLQKHWNKYGEDDLFMTVVKTVNSPEAIRKEINKCKETSVIKEPDITISESFESEIIEPEEVKKPITATIKRTKKTYKKK